MFKKTLVAASLLMAFNASALTITKADGTSAVEVEKVSQQAVATATTAQAFEMGAVTITLKAADYVAGQLVKIDFTGGKFLNGTPELYIAPKAGTFNPATGAATNSTTKSAKLTKVAVGDNSITYQIGTPVAGNASPTPATANSFVDSKIVISADAFQLQRSTLPSAVSMTVTTLQADKTTVIEAPVKVDIFKQVPQFAVEYAVASPQKDKALDGVIDVNNGRLTFKDKATTDELVYSFSNDTSLTDAVTATKVTHVLSGDFSFLDTDSTKDGIQAKSGAVVLDPAEKSGTLKIEADKISWQASAVTNQDNLKVTIDTSKDGVVAAAALTPNTFSLETTVAHSTDVSEAFKLSAGAWTLNGASADIPYVPVGEGLSQFIWVSNKGSVAGDISVTAIDQAGKAYGPYDLGMANKGLTPIASGILAKLKEDGLTSGRVQMNVTVNAPENAVTVYAAYKVDSADDRLSLPVNPVK